MDNKKKVGQAIRNYRTLRGMTQAQLAEAIDCSPSAITMYETGRREPDMDTIEAIADVFNISTRDLVPDDRRPDLFEGLESTSVPIRLSLTEQADIQEMVRIMYKLTPENRKKLLNVAHAMFGEEL